MEVFVNNKSLDVAEGIFIPDTLKKLGIDTKNGIAIAVNNVVIPKAAWQNYTLAQGDKITVIKATQGG